MTIGISVFTVFAVVVAFWQEAAAAIDKQVPAILKKK